MIQYTSINNNPFILLPIAGQFYITTLLILIETYQHIYKYTCTYCTDTIFIELINKSYTHSNIYFKKYI